MDRFTKPSYFKKNAQDRPKKKRRQEKWIPDSSSEGKARKSIEQSFLPGQVQKYRTVSTTGQGTWDRRMADQEARWASKSSRVQVKKKCLSCGVVYDPEVDDHSC